MENSANIERKKGASFKKYLSEPMGLLITALVCFSLSSYAGTYTSKSAGNYSSTDVWEAGYPGNLIKDGDTVFIKSNVNLGSDLVVKGILVVSPGNSLTGSGNLVVLGSGYFNNKGITLVKSITNRGAINNSSVLETSTDFINTGTFENNQSMIVGNILDNTGTITGKRSQIMVNKRMINAETGRINGLVDICSNDFSNVGGAQIDSVNVSFCGNKIFNATYLTASVKKDAIQINLNNSNVANVAEYEIEKSTDGTNYTKIASVKSSEVKDATQPFNFSDNSPVSGKTVFYRMKVIDANGKASLITPVEVGNMQNGVYSVSNL
jgi:hypothetical protein